MASADQIIVSGRKGGGKTFFVLVIMALLKFFPKYNNDDRPIYTDIQVIGELKEAGVRYISSWSELAQMENCVCILDEAGRWANSREYKDFPPELQQFFAQARKKNVQVILVVQNMRRLDVTIRELTDRFFQVDRPWRGAWNLFRWFRRWVHVRELVPDSIIWEEGDTVTDSRIESKTLVHRWMLLPGEPMEEQLYIPIWKTLFELPKIAWNSYNTRQILAAVKKDIKNQFGAKFKFLKSKKGGDEK